MRTLTCCSAIRLALPLLLLLAGPAAGGETQAAERVVRVGVLERMEERAGRERSAVNNLARLVLEEVAEREAWELEWVPGTFPMTLERLQRGDVQLLLALPATEENRAALRFGSESLLSTWGRVYAADGLKLRSLLDLEGQTVAVRHGDPFGEEFAETLRRFNVSCQLIFAHGYGEALRAVDQGFADAALIERTYGAQYASEYDANRTPVIFGPTEVRFAAHPGGDPDLLQTLDYYLALFKGDQGSAYWEQMEDLFGPAAEKVAVWFRWALGIAALLLVASLAAAAALRRKVADQTVELTRTSQELNEEIEARRGQEQQLLRFGTVAEQMEEGVLITDADGRIQYINHAFCTITGEDPEDLVGSTWEQVLRGSEAGQVRRQLEEAMRQGRTWRVGFRNSRRDGTSYQVELSVAPVREVESGEAVNWVALVRDVTHESELEAQLHQSQKLEAIGTLAGGIAHDFNNTLFSMMGYADLARRKMDPSDPRKGMLDQVMQAGERAKQLVKQILTFSRRSEQERKRLDLVPIVKETMKLIRPAVPSTVEINLEKPEGEIPVLADPTQIHQVLMNLCSNGAHAIGHNQGRLDVRLGRELVDEERAASSLNLRPGEYAVVEVEDTGAGMKPEVLERIFEPFFTTKAQGEGTGMGLSVVHGIISTHGGAVEAFSTPGEGTLFRVYLPLTEGSAEQEKAGEPEEVGGSERLLVVDDEAAVVETLRQMLRFLGYEVVATISSREALELIESDPGYDLLITDLTMPGLTGMELAVRSRRCRPSLPVILLTGYGQSVKERDLEEAGISELVQKPVLTHEIGAVIRSVLDRSEAPVS